MDADTAYALGDGGYVAYAASGQGEVDVLFLSVSLSADALDAEPHWSQFLRRLQSCGRLLLVNPRGVGLSDPVATPDELSVASMAGDVLAVLDTVGAKQVAFVADTGAAPVALTLAAEHPDRISSLVLLDASARLLVDRGYPAGHASEVVDAYLDANPDVDDVWSDDGFDGAALLAPSLKGDPQFRRWWTRETRRATSPAVARRLNEVVARADLRARLQHVDAPTLVLHRRDNVLVPVDQGRYLADQLPRARLVELAGEDSTPAAGDVAALADEIEDFLVGHRSGNFERVLTTMLFTDIVQSTVQALALGDRAWREVLDAHYAEMRDELHRYRGLEVNTTGDGIVAIFDSPTQALRCASAMVTASGRSGVEMRAGVHVGECERRGRDIAGIAVHIAARIMALAAPNEVWVSRTVCDLVAGSDIQFDPRGQHTLRGLDTRRTLFALAR